MRVRTLLMGVAALALAGASGAAFAQHRGGHSMGGAPSVNNSAGVRAAPSFSGQTTGAAPNARSNTFSGNRFSGNRFSGTVNRGTTFSNRSAFNGGQWRRDRDFDRDRRRFRGGFFAFGAPFYGYDDDYAYDYPYACDYRGPGWDWRWRRYCGPYAYGYGDGYYGGW